MDPLLCSLSSLPSFWDYSGKMGCLCRLLQAIFEQTNGGPSDKVVVISNFTQTLDYIRVIMWRALPKLTIPAYHPPSLVNSSVI